MHMCTCVIFCRCVCPWMWQCLVVRMDTIILYRYILDILGRVFHMCLDNYMSHACIYIHVYIYVYIRIYTHIDLYKLHIACMCLHCSSTQLEIAGKVTTAPGSYVWTLLASLAMPSALQGLHLPLRSALHGPATEDAGCPGREIGGIRAVLIFKVI